MILELALMALVVVVPCVLLFFMARLVEAATGRSEASAVASLLRLFAWTIASLAVLAFFNFNLIGFFVALAAIVIVLVQRRFAEQDSLIWILALCARRGMPLLPAVAAYGDQCGGLYRIKVRRLQKSLESGMSLPEALARHRGLLPPAGVAAAAVGAETGALARALEDEANCRARQRVVWQTIVLRIVYLASVLCAVAITVGFIMIWIVPEYVIIFEDFEADLPGLTLLVIALSRAIFPGGLMILLLAMMFVGLLFGVQLLGMAATGSAPVVGRILRRHHGAAVLRSLATVAESDRPLERGLEILARSFPAASVWPRLEKVHAAVAGGASCWRSLARHGIIGRGDVAVLEAAQRVGNLPWALREVAERAERRLAYRLQGWTQVLFPLAVTAIASLVALFVVGMMLPLISLIEKASP